jgi:hypothetical protein
VRETQEFLQSIYENIAPAPSNVSQQHHRGFEASSCASQDLKEGVKLKQALMISPEHHRLHWCATGVPFDAHWMRAEDGAGDIVSNQRAVGRRVVLCIQPAILTISSDPPLSSQDGKLSQPFMETKEFFLTHAEKRNLNVIKVLAKAFVLVEEENTSTGNETSRRSADAHLVFE